ncbi:MAG: hypothetical protein V7K64_26000 [Nostoc sp.]|uniref:hypothetical protein n=1 Tax=unclassified Nostoc TaxID=2593658 RepID=UPI001D7D737C|nr:hypothetical protein [Nostoc sp. JL34]MBN3882093.1 hypothetical protein [Nostoc sp. JL34]
MRRYGIWLIIPRKSNERRRGKFDKICTTECSHVGKRGTQIAIAICYKGKVDDPIKYFAAKENQDLGLVKAKKSPVSKLDLSLGLRLLKKCNYLNLSRMGRIWEY